VDIVPKPIKYSGLAAARESTFKLVTRFSGVANYAPGVIIMAAFVRSLYSRVLLICNRCRCRARPPASEPSLSSALFSSFSLSPSQFIYPALTENFKANVGLPSKVKKE
jgi:hypothetical protein